MKADDAFDRADMAAYVARQPRVRERIDVLGSDLVAWLERRLRIGLALGRPAAMQHLEHVAGRQHALARLCRMQRMADDDLVVADEVALFQHGLQRREPDLIIVHRQIFGRVAVLAGEARLVDVPAARHAHRQRQRESAFLPLGMEDGLVWFRHNGPEAVHAAHVLRAVHDIDRVIPGRAEGANPESRNRLSVRIWIPDRRCAASGMTMERLISSPPATSAGRCRSWNRASPVRRVSPRSSLRCRQAAPGLPGSGSRRSNPTRGFPCPPAGSRRSP